MTTVDANGVAVGIAVGPRRHGVAWDRRRRAPVVMTQVGESCHVPSCIELIEHPLLL
jgi:hypothetical protein